MARRLYLIALVFVLTAAACGGAATTTTTRAASTATTTDTASSRAPATATTSQPATTTVVTIPNLTLDVAVAGDVGAAEAVQSLYAWLGDRTLLKPNAPRGLLENLADFFPDESDSFFGELVSEEIREMGTAGVVVVDDQDIILLVDDGAGWRVVGAWFAQYDVDPWFGDPLRYILVIGTDARSGQNQRHYRADSLHILSSNISKRAGGVLGYPRDTYVEASYGGDKFTNVNLMVFTITCGIVEHVDDCDSPNPDAGLDEVVDLARSLSGLPLEGWIVTGFLNFQQMVDAFGGVAVDVPFAMAEPKSQAYLSAGLQTLFGSDALAFSRNRTLTGSDFTRSFHQGLVIMAALDGVLERNITLLPPLLSILMEFTWTDLSLEDLMTVAAGAFLLDPTLIGNDVLPGVITTRSGASIVDLTDGAEVMFRDMDDGSLSRREGG